GAKLYRTGDLVRYLPDGNLEFIGRVDHQIKIRGFRIEMGEIESVLQQYEEVLDAAVTVHEYQTGDKRLIAFIVSDRQQIDVKSLHANVKERLPNYMVPDVISPISEL